MTVLSLFSMFYNYAVVTPGHSVYTFVNPCVNLDTCIPPVCLCLCLCLCLCMCLCLCLDLRVAACPHFTNSASPFNTLHCTAAQVDAYNAKIQKERRRLRKIK